MKTWPACPRCGMVSGRRKMAPDLTRVSTERCWARACEARRDADRTRGGRQCSGERRSKAKGGGTSVRFCLLRENHEGKHLHGCQEWE